MARLAFSQTARPDAGAMEEYAREPWYGDGHRPRNCRCGATASCGRRAGEAPATQRHVPDSGDFRHLLFPSALHLVLPSGSVKRGHYVCLEVWRRTNHSTFPLITYLSAPLFVNEKRYSG